MSSQAPAPEKTSGSAADAPPKRQKKGKEARKTQFPMPPVFQVNDTEEKPFGAKRLFEYWAAIPEVLRPLVKFGIYRVWPACDFQVTGERDGKDNSEEILHGPMPFDDPEKYHDWFLHTYGSGQWNCYLSEESVSGNVMRGFVHARDIDHCPPKIDHRTLVNDKANDWYIKWCRRNKVELPWDDPNAENEGDNMQVGEALKTVVDATVSMANRNVDLANEAATAKVEAAEAKADARVAAMPAPAASNVGVDAAVKLMSDTTSKMVDMVTKNAGTQFDPLKIIEAMDKRTEQQNVVAAKLIDSNNTYFQSVVSIQKDTLAAMREITEKLSAPKPESTAVAAAAVPPRRFVDEILELKEMADVMGWRTSRERTAVQPRDDDREPPAPAKSITVTIAENLPVIISGLTTMAALILGVVHNVRAKTLQDLQTPSDVLKNATATAGAATAAGGGAGAGAGAGGGDPRASWAGFIQQIEAGFISHFFGDQTSGYTFAGWLISDGSGAGPTLQGRKNYDTVKEQLGPQGFHDLIASYLPIMSKVQGTPQKYKQFLHEFFTYDQWLEEQDNEPGDTGVPAGAPAGAAA